MNRTGIVRRIDDLGRVVIPKEIRRTLRIREGDPLEIFVGSEEVTFRKYSPINELGDFASHYANALHKTTGHIVCIADKDTIIAVSGAPKGEYISTPISSDLEKIIESCASLIVQSSNELTIPILCTEHTGEIYSAQVISTIVSEAEPIGAVMLLSKKHDTVMGATEVKLAETASVFLRKQIEE